MKNQLVYTLFVLLIISMALGCKNKTKQEAKKMIETSKIEAPEAPKGMVWVEKNIFTRR